MVCDLCLICSHLSTFFDFVFFGLVKTGFLIRFDLARMIIAKRVLEKACKHFDYGFRKEIVVPSVREMLIF